jgi:hypothetical protein
MGSRNKRKDKKRKKGRKVSHLRQVKIALPQAMLIPDTEFFLTKDEAQKLNKAQNVMNGLYKPGSKYGDQSSAFMVLIEQAKGGVGNHPKRIVGDTLHDEKCRDHSRSGKGLHRHLGIGLPAQAEARIRTEIAKMQQAIKWADDYRAGKNPKLPSWARAFQADIEQLMEEMRDE